jgi:single-stranded-DNA-specific exonuclease
MTRIAIRSFPTTTPGWPGLHPTLARILSARGVPTELATDLPELVPPAAMKGIGHAPSTWPTPLPRIASC